MGPVSGALSPAGKMAPVSPRGQLWPICTGITLDALPRTHTRTAVVLLECISES